MANSLNRDLNNCLVVLGREHYPDDPKWDDEENRTVLTTGGFGCNASTMGGAIFVRDRWGKSWRAEGHQVERCIREVPEDERAIPFIVNVMSPAGVETYEVTAVTDTNATHQVLAIKGWENLPRSIGMTHDDTLIEVDGVEYAIAPKAKGVSE